MWLFVNPIAASLLGFSIGFYVFVYTLWLKRRTTQNIVIGGLAGALPPAIGWAAATNGLALAPLVLVLIVFLWTPPHFWALSLYRSDDYARAGVPMLPVVRGKRATRRQIFLYAIALVPLASCLRSSASPDRSMRSWRWASAAGSPWMPGGAPGA